MAVPQVAAAAVGTALPAAECMNVVVLAMVALAATVLSTVALAMAAGPGRASLAVAASVAGLAAAVGKEAAAVGRVTAVVE